MSEAESNARLRGRPRLSAKLKVLLATGAVSLILGLTFVAGSLGGFRDDFERMEKLKKPTPADLRIDDGLHHDLWSMSFGTLLLLGGAIALVLVVVQSSTRSSPPEP